jgi:hypothetical protein
MDLEYMSQFVEVNADKTTYIVHGHVWRSECRAESQYKKG